MITSIGHLKPFVAPESETAFFKNIPISELENVQKMLRTRYPGLSNDGLRFLYRFRGSRSQAGKISRQQTCLKKDANRFSVYMVAK